MKVITQNKKAFHEYSILDRIEAGIVLKGDEVKSIRAGHVSLVGAYATFHQGELNLINCNISPYKQAYDKREDVSTRSRKLLLHKQELNKLVGQIAQKGITVVPLKIYINERGLIKVELGIAKHKKMAEKKKALKERDIKRETARELKKYNS